MAFQSTFMQQQTKTLPTHTTSSDGKGRHTLVQTSHWLGVLAFTAVLLLLAGCLYADNHMERSQFFSDLMQEHRVEEQQRAHKLEAETRLTEASAVMGNQAAIERAHQSDLRIMAQHIAFVQQDSHSKIEGLVESSKLKDNEDFAELKEKLLDLIKEAQQNVVSIVHNRITNVEADTAHYEKEVQHIQDEIVHELADEQQEDEANKEQEPEVISELAKAVQSKVDGKVNAGLAALFAHVNALADKMGDTDVDALLESSNVKAWEAILSDTESGKLAYPEGIKKMEMVVEKFPAVLKLAEAQGVIQLVEGDGGVAGVSEVTNFRALLAEVRRLPQYSKILEVYDSWKAGKHTVGQVLAWLQEKMEAKELDADWIVAATSAAVNSGAPATSKQHKLMDHASTS